MALARGALCVVKPAMPLTSMSDEERKDHWARIHTVMVAPETIEAFRRFSRAMRAFSTKVRLIELRAADIRRGRKARTGHRHRGTVAWERRYRTKER